MRMPPMRSRTKGLTIFDPLNNFFMFVFSLVAAYPFIYIIFFSISSPSRVADHGLLVYPKGLDLSSYAFILKQDLILNSAMVSLARTVIATVLMLIVTSQAAYVLTRKNLMFHKTIMKFFIITMYVSAGLIPQYMLIKILHLDHSFWVYIVPSLFGGAFSMILIKTYIEGLPGDLEEAASIDGLNDIQIFYRIILPLCKPVIAAIALFSAIGQWNAYFDTMLYNSSIPKLYTIQYVLMILLNAFGYSSSIEAIQRMAENKSFTPYSLQTAMTVIATLPILLAYPYLQKHFTKGLLIGSIKG